MGNAATTLDSQRKADQAKLRDKNTQNFLDTLASYKTVGDLTQANSQGIFDNLRASYGNNIDRERVRGAYDSALSALQNRTNSTDKFQDTQQLRENRGVIDDALVLARQGKGQEAKELVTSVDSPDTSKFLGQIDTILQAKADQTRKDRVATKAEERGDYSFDRLVKTNERADNQLERNNQIFSTVRGAYQSNELAGKEYSDKVNELALSRYGKNVGQLTPDEAQTINGEIGFNTSQSSSDLLRSTLEQLRKDGVIKTAADEQAAIDNFNLMDSLAGKVVASDQETLNKQLTLLDEAYKPQQNPFTQELTTDPFTAAQQIVSESNLGSKLDGSELEEAVSQVNSLITEGLVLKEGEEPIPVTPALVKLALENVGEYNFSSDVSPKDSITKLIKGIGIDRINQYLKEAQEYKTSKRQLGTAFLSNIGSVRQNQRSANLDALLQNAANR